MQNSNVEILSLGQLGIKLQKKFTFCYFTKINRELLFLYNLPDILSYKLKTKIYYFSYLHSA